MKITFIIEVINKIIKRQGETMIIIEKPTLHSLPQFKRSYATLLLSTKPPQPWQDQKKKVWGKKAWGPPPPWENHAQNQILLKISGSGNSAPLWSNFMYKPACKFFRFLPRTVRMISLFRSDHSRSQLHRSQSTDALSQILQSATLSNK